MNNRYRSLLLSFIVFIVIKSGGFLCAQSIERLPALISLSNKTLNYSSSNALRDSILSLCNRIETVAKKTDDLEAVFLVSQIKVNATSKSGQTGLAIIQAQDMYKKAKEKNFQLGRALSLQAIGNTYMHTNLYRLAADTFAEAESELDRHDNYVIKSRLAIQQIHVFLKLNETEKAVEYLNRIESLSQQIPFTKKDLEFQIYSYWTLAAIQMGNENLVELYWQKVNDLLPKESIPIDGLLFDLSINYYLFTKDYPKAVAFSDSLIAISKKGENAYVYKNALQSQATVSKMLGDAQKACEIYQQVQKINQTLKMERFATTLDSIRSNYLIDRINLENSEAHGDLLKRIVFFSLIILIIICVLILLTKKKNKLLAHSRRQLAEASEKARHSILTKSLFLSNMTHEIRTPLNAIVGFSEILSSSKEFDIDEETRQMCGDRIRMNAQLLHKLINDVMRLTEQEESNMTFSFDKHDAVSLCRHVIDTVERVKRTSAKIDFQTTLNELELYTDNTRLQQVLINILINATKFTPSGSITLLLTLDTEQKEAVFTIEDTGCGIPLDKQSGIFSRFEKLHEGVQGSGIGLSICQSIVEHLKGRIWIDPKYTAGARFVFTHPLDNNVPEL